MLEAEQALVMLDMLRRAEAEDAALDASVPLADRVTVPDGRVSEFVIDEIAVHLVCTRVAASHRFALAQGVAMLRALKAAWRGGCIDGRKAAVISEGLHGSDPAWADATAVEACRYASERTAPQVRQWLSRRGIATDPGSAEIRRKRATAGRRVTLNPLLDGVTELTALLPSVQARQIYETVNTLARSASADDVRTMDQRRADALIDLLVGRADPPQVQVQVIIPADTLLGEGGEPGWVAGIGAVTVAEVAELLGQPNRCTCDDSDRQPGPFGAISWRPLVADPESGALLAVAEQRYRPSAGLERAIRARDLSCRFPGCRRPAATAGSGTDLDHVIPCPRGQTVATNLASL